MSCYEWESGDIVIPRDQWADFKKNLRAAYNSALTADLRLVEQTIAKIKATHKGKRGVDWEKALREELNPVEQCQGLYRFENHESRYLRILNSYSVAQKVLLRKEQTLKDGAKKIITRMGSLKKKDFPLANGKTMSFGTGDCEIILFDKKHSVLWQVHENNHACEMAHQSIMGRALFDLLHKIEWKRNSGGCIVGNDEYNREAGRNEPGGGGNVLKSIFGPIGKAAQEFEWSPRGRRRR